MNINIPGIIKWFLFDAKANAAALAKALLLDSNPAGPDSDFSSVDPFYIDGYRYNPEDEKWYSQEPNPQIGQGWGAPASPEKQVQLTGMRNNVLHWYETLQKPIPSIKQSTSDFFTTAQKYPNLVDPLTLDLNGDGINTVPLQTPPLLFDINASGIKTSTGWIAPDDGLLVYDRNGNGNGVIDSGAELFGNATPAYGTTANGKTADGFAALAQEDSNHDGLVNAQDANWSSLQIWQDLNQDGISQGNELTALAQQGIAGFNVGRTQNSQTLANGNQVADLGTFIGRLSGDGLHEANDGVFEMRRMG